MKFKIVTMDNCRYCRMAKVSLTMRDLDYEEEVACDNLKEELRSHGLLTLPQIWLEGHGHIGGYTELVSFLDQRGL